jgi:hypothetical protein
VSLRVAVLTLSAALAAAAIALGINAACQGSPTTEERIASLERTITVGQRRVDRQRTELANLRKTAEAEGTR